MKILLQLVTSSLTVLSVWMAGNKDMRFNYLGLFNQLLWAMVILTTGTYGIFPLTGAMTYVYSRNIYKWKKNLEK